MKIAVIGSGAREHALVWSLKHSAPAADLLCLPGNAGIAELATCQAADLGNVESLGEELAGIGPDLIVVGPEQPLIAGLADVCLARGTRIVGPPAAGARLEGSKVFAKEFMLRHGIPTAPLCGIYDSPGEAYTALCAAEWPLVIKADGPCAGKGVVVANSPDEATAFIERLMEKREFGAAGDRVLMEEALAGRELSYIILTDGEHALPLAAAKDYKRLLDNDLGPNTGGMGAVSTDTLLAPELRQAIEERIVRPTLTGLQQEGIPYRGFLYFGLMITEQGPHVLEFNCRLGDPEAEVILPRLASSLLELLEATLSGELDRLRPHWLPEASVAVVLASAGYPGAVAAGKRIEGLAEATRQPGVLIFHAGTRREDGQYVTAGGRVLAVTARAASAAQAAARAYTAVGCLHFDGMQYRKDICKDI